MHHRSYFIFLSLLLLSTSSNVLSISFPKSQTVTGLSRKSLGVRKPLLDLNRVQSLSSPPTNTNHTPTMSQRKIDILQLDPQQILEIRKSTDQEIQHFTQSLQALQTAQSKLQDCVNTIDNMEASKGEDILVPMTALLYLPGKVVQKDRFMVDIGTGYFVEKDAESARKVYKKKLTKLGEDSKKLKEILVQKNEIMNNLTLVLRKKVTEQQQQASQS